MDMYIIYCNKHTSECKRWEKGAEKRKLKIVFKLGTKCPFQLVLRLGRTKQKWNSNLNSIIRGPQQLKSLKQILWILSGLIKTNPVVRPPVLSASNFLVYMVFKTIHVFSSNNFSHRSVYEVTIKSDLFELWGI